jgi:hypothetical protein
VIEPIERMRSALGADPWPSAADVEAGLGDLPFASPTTSTPGACSSAGD